MRNNNKSELWDKGDKQSMFPFFDFEFLVYDK